MKKKSSGGEEIDPWSRTSRWLSRLIEGVPNTEPDRAADGVADEFWSGSMLADKLGMTTHGLG
jgi:hypothetical protein